MLMLFLVCLLGLLLLLLLVAAVGAVVVVVGAAVVVAACCCSWCCCCCCSLSCFSYCWSRLSVVVFCKLDRLCTAIRQRVSFNHSAT